ncbi:MAG: N-acetyltransferase [Micropepsaceae bacterium]
MTVAVRRETAADHVRVDALVAEAFGPGRYAKSAYRLREGVKQIEDLSFVAEADGRVVGTVRYWPVDANGTAAIMLGPIAVATSMQGQGIALRLMQVSLDAARAAGHRIVLLVGDEPYYARAGFKRIAPLGAVSMPGPVDPARLLGLALQEGALEGLKGELRKPRIDYPRDALGAGLAPLATPAK